MWHQQTLTLGPKSRGFHLVTDEILGQIREISRVKTGLLHLLLQHTSASLTLNENCDPTVRYDMEQHFLHAVPDNAPYEHDYEGPDDMPSHIKSSMLGVSLMPCVILMGIIYCRNLSSAFLLPPISTTIFSVMAHG